jgi:hypothetical protein
VEIEQKKEHVLRCVRIGLDFYKSCLIATCTESEIDQLREDEDFQEEIGIVQAVEEYRLLESLDEAIHYAKNKGNSSGIQWKLERLNPDKWGKREKKTKDFNGSLRIVLEGEDADNND